jgi:hypothetical protein
MRFPDLFPKSGQKKQAVIDFLSQPLPVPKGAKVLGPRNYGGSVGSGTVAWRGYQALDVTDMKPEEIETIPEMYASYFENRFPFGTSGRGSQSLGKSGPDYYRVGSYSEWTWLRQCEFSGGDFDLDIDCQVFDFKKDNTVAGGYRRVSVNMLSDPIQDQRVAWIRFSFKGRNLEGMGKWPEIPSSAPTTKIGL